jgi:hypothetical protein
MALLLQDDFTRANSTTVVGSPVVGPAPVTQSGVAGISSNALYASTAAGAITWDLGTPNVELSVLASTITAANYVMVMLGFVSTTDFWGVGMYSDNMSLMRGNAAGVWAMHEVAVANASGTKLTASYRDGVIRAYRNDLMIMNFEVDIITSTKHGVRMNTATARADELRGYDSPALDADTTGETVSVVGLEGDPFIPSAFVYQGHDTKIQDLAAGA